MRILITGAAGFIGFHLSQKLVALGHEIVGLDNINGYYRNALKFDRLGQLGIPLDSAARFNFLCTSDMHKNFSFVRFNLEDGKALTELFSEHQFEMVVHLAAQAGVRYSLDNPHAYVNSNIVGFLNILECCRNHEIIHLIYASSSSVYGLNKKVPFSVEDKVNQPISLYAATKRSNELMAHTYSHLFQLSVTGLRFFTVYGPWGRPDMAMYKFTEAIINGKPIKVFNNGLMERDFTYVDDIVNGILEIINKRGVQKIKAKSLFELYNLGSSKSIQLKELIETIEHCLDLKAKRILLPLQPGDVVKTWADMKDFKAAFDYTPSTEFSKGVNDFVKWYKEYHKL